VRSGKGSDCGEVETVDESAFTDRLAQIDTSAAQTVISAHRKAVGIRASCEHQDRLSEAQREVPFDLVVAQKGYIEHSWFDLLVSDQIYDAKRTGRKPEPDDQNQDSGDG